MKPITLMTLLLLCFGVVQASWKGRMEPNSFLIYPVYSVKELAHQIRTEPEVALRFAMHFGVNAYSLADYVEKNLRLGTLQKNATYLVYHCKPDRKIGGKYLRLKKGTQVFALRDGTPVLKRSCGNPMLNVVSMSPIIPESSNQFQAMRSSPSLGESVSLTPTIPEELAPESPPPAVLGITTSLPEAEMAALPAMGPALAAPALVIPAWGAVPGVPLSVPAFLPGAILPTIGGGGIIPEPATAVTLLIGLGALRWMKGNGKQQVGWRRLSG